MPVEIMLLPKWFPFHIDKISYWARTVIVPLLVLQALKPKAKNPKGVAIDELFLQDPKTIGPKSKAPHQKWSWFLLFRALDAVLRVVEPMFPKSSRQRAIDKAVAFVTERLNGEDGLGAIFPAMANSAMMYRGAGLSEPSIRTTSPRARRSTSCWSSRTTKPTASPACRRCGTRPRLPRAARGRHRRGGRRRRRRLELADAACRCSTCAATGSDARPDVRPGGWAFQYANPHYPDLDDTAVVVMAMDRAQKRPRQHALPARDRPRPGMDRAACRARTAAGARSTPTTSISTSTTSRSPTTARCSTRRPRTSPAAASPCWRSSAKHRTMPGARRHRLSAPHPARRRKLVRPLGHELHLRNLVGAVRAQRSRPRSPTRPRCERRATGSFRFKTATAAGARTAPATSSTTAAMRRRRAPPRRPPGR